MASTAYRVLIAPACFKGSASALEIAEWINDFLRNRLPEYVITDVCPIADGGDDTLSVLQASDSGFQLQQMQVMGPVPEMKVQAHYLVHTEKKQVIIEAAQAHGLKLLPPDQLAPMRATSYGVGELIRQAIAHEQPHDIIVTVGGSASTDAGIGMLQALGVQFFDAAGMLIQEPIDGHMLSGIQKINWNLDWPHAGRVLIATDVVNPLLGSEGAAAVFAPQKGANSEQCQILEAGLAHVSRLLSQIRGMDYTALPGVGAAGGLAYGLQQLPRAGIISGSQWVAEQLNLFQKIQQADIVITGEGRFDATSFGGKATGNVLVWASDKPVFIVCGHVRDKLEALGDVAVYSLAKEEADTDAAITQPQRILIKRLEEMLPDLLKRL